MLNKTIIEGFIHDIPTKHVSESGKAYYTGTLCCYRDGGKRQYDCVSLIFTRQQFDFYKKLVGEGRPRICVVGHIRTFKGIANMNVQIEYFALYPFTQILTGGAKEVVYEEDEVLDDDSQEIDKDLMPF